MNIKYINKITRTIDNKLSSVYVCMCKCLGVDLTRTNQPHLCKKNKWQSGTHVELKNFTNTMN